MERAHTLRSGCVAWCVRAPEQVHPSNHASCATVTENVLDVDVRLFVRAYVFPYATGIGGNWVLGTLFAVRAFYRCCLGGSIVRVVICQYGCAALVARVNHPTPLVAIHMLV